MCSQLVLTTGAHNQEDVFMKETFEDVQLRQLANHKLQAADLMQCATLWDGTHVSCCSLSSQ